MARQNDADPVETREWLDAVESVIAHEGVDRARFLLERLIGQVRKAGVDLPFSANTRTSTRSRPRKSRGGPAISSSRGASPR